MICYGCARLRAVGALGSVRYHAAHNESEEPFMSAERESGLPAPDLESHDDPHAETLTDFMDRMDREAFRRSLEQRDLRMLDAFIVRVPGRSSR